MADLSAVEEAARALIAAILEKLREHERAVRLRPTSWMDLFQDGGMTVMALPDYPHLEAALEAAFPDRLTGPLGTHEHPSQFIWALVDGVVLAASSRYHPFDITEAEASVAIGDMLELIQRDRDRVVAARVITDLRVDKPFMAGSVELRPVGSWGLNDAYRDIDGFMPGAGQLLDEDAKYRVGGSFTYTTLRTEADAPLPAHIHDDSGVRRQALAQLETLTTALRLATAATSQVVVDIDSPPGRVRLLKPQVHRHDIAQMEMVQRIGRVDSTDAGALASLGDRLARWGGDDERPHSVGVALSRFNRSFASRPWFDTLVDIAVGLEAALLGRKDVEEIGLRLRSRAAALLATPADPAATIYADVKRLYNLRSLIVHGSNPTVEQLGNQAYEISVAARTRLRGEKWALVMDRCRDLLRRAILARGFLTDAGEWPTRGNEAERFDVDSLLVDPRTRNGFRKTWRRGLTEIGLPAAANEAPAAALSLELPDHGAGPIGAPVTEDVAVSDPNADPNRGAD